LFTARASAFVTTFITTFVETTGNRVWPPNRAGRLRQGCAADQRYDDGRNRGINESIDNIDDKGSAIAGDGWRYAANWNQQARNDDSSVSWLVGW